ncbi:hypothetical protein Aple_017690 [Acrocarpospora pleiomorpha]|uniref:Uncharacterized protein n=1 Tax=Acrocarpospora pleiomorpha TaxID=90975 RepID=A0A5M3XCG6_9ACTN|nr:hypothetical protein Aple_017690 [Acrocarpospora pleiomorpha]
MRTELSPGPTASDLRRLEVLAVLGVAPRSGKSLNKNNPNANILTLAFGPEKQGMVTYMVLEDRRHVEILKVMWLGL